MLEETFTGVQRLKVQELCSHSQQHAEQVLNGLVHTSTPPRYQLKRVPANTQNNHKWHRINNQKKAKIRVRTTWLRTVCFVLEFGFRFQTKLFRFSCKHDFKSFFKVTAKLLQSHWHATSCCTNAVQLRRSERSSFEFTWHGAQVMIHLS